MTGIRSAPGDVVIGSDVWIGQSATIVSGTVIGNGAVVGAGAVVSGEVPSFAIVAGDRAEIVRYRFTEEQRAALTRIAWWEWPLSDAVARVESLCSTDIDDFSPDSTCESVLYVPLGSPAMTSSMRQSAKLALRASGLLEPARRLKSALAPPAASERQRRDDRAMRTILSVVLSADSNCIDVGAHTGAVLQDILRIAPKGRHIAYEPIPALADGLAARFPAVVVGVAGLRIFDLDGEGPYERDRFAASFTAPLWNRVAR